MTKGQRSVVSYNEIEKPVSVETILRTLRVLEFEYCDALFWRADDVGGFKLFINCNDFFHWACADAEEITDDNVDLLEDTFKEVQELKGKWDAHDAPLLFCARSRKMRPQGAFYKHLDTDLHHLFNAAGPDRDLDLFNPKEPGQ
jgi:hypothetical protein